MRLFPTLLSSFCLLLTFWGTSPVQALDWMAQAERPPSASEVSPPETRPIDGRDFIPVDAFQRTEEEVWFSPEMKTRFDYDELIYSWSVRLPEGEGFRLYVSCGFSDGQSTPWLYAGYWGQVDLVEGRTNPVFEQGRLAMDQIFLKEKAKAYQFKVVDEGGRSLSVLPALHVLYTDNSPSPALWRRFGGTPKKAPVQSVILDLPLRSQRDPEGRWTGRCQSAALGSAMEYFGKPIGLEAIIRYTFDPEYNYPGIWPRTIGAGIEFGFDAYIDRFRDWERVRATVAENKVILCSIRMPKNGGYIDPPYSSMGGHIVALNGVTDDGRVVVTDSALFKDRRGYRCQWLREDFEKIWMRNKGGVGMVICPPKGAVARLVPELPEFPGYGASGR